MKKILITGSEGFIGRHLTAELAANGCTVIRSDMDAVKDVTKLDIMDAAAVRTLIAAERPEAVIHLAGQANVGLSWKKPQDTVALNTIGFLNLAEAIRSVDKGIRLIIAGSADEYGRLQNRGINVTEEVPLDPVTPYAISKQMQEQFAQLYVKNFDLDICMLRLFNLGGAGQKKGFLLSDFASEIAAIELGQKAYMSVGNLESARDFTHIKDACRAIRLILEHGHTGEVYNICSGKAYPVREVLEHMRSMAKVPIEVRQDAARMRPSDTPVISGDHSKLTAHTGWTPMLGMDEIITDVLEYQRGEAKKMLEFS